MGFPKFIKKLFRLQSAAAPQTTAAGSYHFEEPTGYYTVRGEDFNRAYTAWCQAKVLSIDKIKALAPSSFIENLNNRSGYVREFCLRALALHDWTDAFKPVVQRLNDYVPINRELATQLTVKLLATLPIATVIETLPELSALGEQSRSNHAAVNEAMQHRLDAPLGLEALKTGTSHNHAKVRSICWKWCLQKFSWTGPERIDAAMLCGDPAIARSVEQDVFTLPDEDLKAWFDKIHQVRAMPLRRAFLVAARRRGLVEDTRLTACALWDDSFSIRWLARFWSKDTPDILLQHYLAALEADCTPRRMRYALEGLAILKAQRGLDVVKKTLLHENVVIRKAALIAVCEIDPENVPVYISNALQDADLVVVRQAFKLLATLGMPLPLEALHTVANKRCDELPFFVLLLDCAKQLSVWPAMHLATFTSQTSPALKSQVQAHIDNFISRLVLTQVYVGPTQTQWQAICNWLPADKLAPKSSLRFVIEIYAKRMNTPQ
jgi:hypothetical protein